MTWFLSATMMLFAVGTKPGQQPVARIAGPVSTTTFECMDLGRLDDLCWAHNELTICATAEQGIEIVDTGIEAMGNRSLASWEPCISDAEPGLLLAFDPPVVIGQMSVAQHPQSQMDRVQVSCYSAGGDLSTADVYEPDEPVEVFTFGLRANPGYVACLVRGVADDIRVWTEMP